MAGGFMSGFGQAFTNSFNKASDQRAQKEDDQFKLMYSDYISRRDKTEAEDKANAQYVKKAKMFAANYAGNENAWGAVYEMVSSGLDDSQIIKRLEEYDLEVAPNTVPTNDGSGVADPNSGLTKSAETSVNAQMSQSGMAPPAEGEGLFGKFKPDDDVMDRMTETTGKSREEIEKAMSSGSDIDGGSIPGLDDYKVVWKKKAKQLSPEDILAQKKYELELKKFELESAGGTPQQQRKIDLEIQKGEIELELLKNPTLTPLQRKELELEQGRLDLDIRKQDYEEEKAAIAAKAEADKIVTVPENSRAIRQGSGETVLEAAPKVPDATNVTSQEEAVAYREWAYESGTPADKQRADRLMEAYTTLESSKIRQTAKAKGELFVPKGAVLRDENNNFIKTLQQKLDRDGNVTWVDPATGKPPVEGIVQEYTPEMEKDVDEMTKSLGKPVTEYNTGVGNFKQATRLSKEIITLAKTYQGTGLGRAGDWSQTVTGMVKDFDRVVRILTTEDLQDGTLDPATAPTRIKQLNDIEGQLQTQLGGTALDNAAKAALAASLIETKATKLAYMLAAGSGQEGRSVTNVELDRFKDIILSGGNPEAMQKSLADSLSGMQADLVEKERQINQASPEMRRFTKKHNMPSPFVPAETMKEVFENDEVLRTTFDELTGGKDTTKQVKGTTTVSPEWITDKSDADLWGTTPEFDALLKKKYGQK